MGVVMCAPGVVFMCMGANIDMRVCLCKCGCLQAAHPHMRCVFGILAAMRGLGVDCLVGVVADRDQDRGRVGSCVGQGLGDQHDAPDARPLR